MTSPPQMPFPTPGASAAATVGDGGIYAYGPPGVVEGETADALGKRNRSARAAYDD